MAYILEKGVVLYPLHPLMPWANHVVASAFAEAGYDTVVTAGLNGTHSPGSLHPLGMALDYRSRHLPAHINRDKFAAAVQAKLGPKYFFAHETNPVHFHLQVETTVASKLLAAQLAAAGVVATSPTTPAPSGTRKGGIFG